MHARIILLSLVFSWLAAACQLTPDPGKEKPEPEPQEPVASTFIRGADLSYVNEMLSCGGTYFNESGQQQDPYSIFADAGTDLVRVRIWHNPDWTEFSNEADVTLTIERAKAEGMKVLLDFHYSDDWTDPAKQVVPAAWLGVVGNVALLGDSVHNYTYRILKNLHAKGLLPEYVQVGNETNREILQDPGRSYSGINWPRNANLLNRGLSAVRDASKDFGEDIEVMLHIAQPENALWWFEAATQNGLTNYDWIAISYYPIWSDYTLDNLPQAINTLKTTYNKRVMVVETAYPFTLDNADNANNILGGDALVTGYPATEDGQLGFLKALEKRISDGGGEGLVYWEPAWISTSCRTQWGQGSHWDNSTLFNHARMATKGMSYYSGQ